MCTRAGSDKDDARRGIVDPLYELMNRLLHIKDIVQSTREVTNE